MVPPPIRGVLKQGSIRREGRTDVSERRQVGVLADPSDPDPSSRSPLYLRTRFDNDVHVQATPLFDEVTKRSALTTTYPIFAHRGLRQYRSAARIVRPART
jgi:hypothetical protein